MLTAARLYRLVVALALMLALAAPALARGSPDDLPTVALVQLPLEARDCYVRILHGGPFPYDRDGVAFGNRERLLPSMPRGYYHEYTVHTPDAHNRGARRIVCGGPQKTPDACYYTDDHYRSFRRIVQ
jgi:ribonuclease T1